MIRISLIIPLHNSEQYLPPLLDSIAGQDYLLLHRKEVEILFVDDHCTDSTLDIVKSYKSKLPHHQILSLEGKKGAGAARNYGLREAKGEYIWYIDSDDLLSSTALTQLITCADTTGAELISFHAEKTYDHAPSEKLPGIYANRHWKQTFIRYGLGPWSLFMRRTFLLDHKLFFPEGIIHEDMALMSTLPLHTDRFSFVPSTLYYYRQHSDSVLHETTYSPRIFDIFPALDFLYRHFESTGNLEKYHDELEYFFIWNLLDDAAITFGHYPEARAGFLRIREMMDERFPHWRKNRYLREKSAKIRFRLSLAYLGITKDSIHNF